MKYSIIIPNYNHGRVLGNAISAAIKAGFDEVVVVDDASTDNSLSVVAGFMHSSLKLVKHVKNQGVNAALNTGIKNSTGDWLLLGAADDETGPNLLRELKPLTVYFPDVGVVSGKCAMYCLDTGMEWVGGSKMMSCTARVSPSGCERLAREGRLYISNPAALFRRNALYSVGGMHEAHRWHADWFVAFTIAFRFGIGWCPEVLGHAYLSSNGYYGRHAYNMAARSEVIERILLDLESDEFKDEVGYFSRSGFIGQLGEPVLNVVLSNRRHARFVSISLFRHAIRRRLERLGRKYAPRWLGQFLIDRVYA